jgi:hypothetical protein
MRPADQALREAVLRRLALLDGLAVSSEPEESLIPMARAELSRLTDGWRLLLTVHQPDDDRKCVACPRSWWRRRWPCRIWLMAYEHLMGEAPPRQPRGGRDQLRRLRIHPRPE